MSVSNCPPVRFTLLLLALVSTGLSAVGEQHPHARLPVVEWDGLDIELPMPIYLKGEMMEPPLRITNTTGKAFPLMTGVAIDGNQLLWVPYRDGKPLEFAGALPADPGLRGEFSRSPLETRDPGDFRWFKLQPPDQRIDRFEPGQTHEFKRTVSGSLGLSVSQAPDAVRPYLLTPNMLLTQAPLPVRVLDKRVEDYPMVLEVEWLAAPQVPDRSARVKTRLHEVDLEGERFLFENFGFRMCRIPRGLAYKVDFKQVKQQRDDGFLIWDRFVTVSFPGSKEPAFVSNMRGYTRPKATDETDPDRWARKMGCGTSARKAREAARRTTPPAEGAAKPSSLPPAIPGPVAHFPSGPSWRWFALGALVLVLGIGAFLIARAKKRRPGRSNRKPTA